ncbi:MAG: palindromic element RPE1 domain-containing protein [Holosporales bacterium]|nr:palindromic element RPE1 domain-containing protein [Holosporales bacterium]
MRVLSKPSESELLEGDTEHRTAAYLSVREDSSTESTHQEAECGELRKSSIGRKDGAQTCRVLWCIPRS